MLTTRANLSRTKSCSNFIRNFFLRPSNFHRHASSIADKTYAGTPQKKASNNFTKRYKSGKTNSTDCFIPIDINSIKDPDIPNEDDVWFIKKISKEDKIKILTKFFEMPLAKEMALEEGLDSNLFDKTCVSFRNYCISREILPMELNVVMSDLLATSGNPINLFPYFIGHAKTIFPHLTCLKDLKAISDLRHPANWYPEARKLKRKIIFHAGPTNSGKTYHALKRYTTSKSGLYCAPLKLLAVEVFNKTNELGTSCDLITGEERQYAINKDNPASHISCTIEMASLRHTYDVAVIDEIQMIRDPSRGWAWTRALLGLCASEIHLCGEAAALDLIKELIKPIGETLEFHEYKRLTSLIIEDHGLNSLSNVEPGDCIVCFSKNDIHKVSRELERLGHNCAVIYGSLPPGTKLSLTRKFNDPLDPCKVLVATDAIGMGLNLSIRRIIFYSLKKPILNEEGEKEISEISTSQALQIAGRAGRFGTSFSEGRVTTFRTSDLPLLKAILDQPVEPIQTAGIHPPAELIELFAYHLPKATLSNLIDIFMQLCQLDTVSYHMCDLEGFKQLADMIQHLDLSLRTRYVLCTAPINLKSLYLIAMFRKFAVRFEQNAPITWFWLQEHLGYPFQTPSSIRELMHLESVFDVFDLYLWLSYRFPDMFPDVETVRHIQKQLDLLIQQGILNINKLIRDSTDEVEQTSAITKPVRILRRGKVSDHLISQGHLSKSDLEDLKKELEKEILKKYKLRPSKRLH